VGKPLPNPDVFMGAKPGELSYGLYQLKPGELFISDG
jgi:hypothetical protein